MRLHNRKAQTKPARRARTLIEPMEFEKHLTLLRFRNADAGIEHVDPHPAAFPLCSRSARALRRVLDGVGNKILQKAAQQPTVRTNGQRRQHEDEFRPLARAERRQFDSAGASVHRCGIHHSASWRAPLEPRKYRAVRR